MKSAQPIRDRLREIKHIIKKYPKFFGKYFGYNKQERLEIKNIFPCLFDDTEKTGYDRHYIYHPAWAARKLAQTKPKKHVDISSTLQFSTLVSAFIPVDFYDFRPAEIRLSNFNPKKADLTKLHFKDNSIESLSCMHTVEHIGLGRYGDPLDHEGDIKAIKELQRVLKPNGNLFFVAPVGKPKVMFNAHRIYSHEQILKYFADLKLIEFSLIPEDCKTDIGIIENATTEQANNETYACGCYWFTK